MKSDELNQIYEKIKGLTNAAKKPLLSPTADQVQVRLLIDESVTPAKFRQSQVDPNIYYATSVTISAVKKDLFLTGVGFEDVQDLSECTNCHQSIDKQFWYFCPLCEGKIA